MANSKCEILQIDPIKPEHRLIGQAAEYLKTSGGVIAYPTETVYGLGCSAFDANAVERIYKLKNRDRSKALILIASDILQISELVESIPEPAEKLIENFWPGPLTLVFHASSRLQEFAFRQSKTVAVRIPDSPICLSLIKETGLPLVSTSANISGEPEAISAKQICSTFSNEIDLIIDGGLATDKIPSTVVDVTRTPVRIVRCGAISDLEIKTVLNTE